MKKFICILICFVLALPLFSTAACADNEIDLDRPVSMSVKFLYDSILIPNANFDVFFVADVDSSGTKYTLSDTFTPYIGQVTNLDKELSGLNSQTWQTVANDLKGIAITQDLTPICSGTTDANGTIDFPQQFKAGLYLVVGYETVYGQYVYIPFPSLVLLPSWDVVDKQWDYDVTVIPKRERYPVSDEKTISVTVTKYWDDSHYPYYRPEEITVHLYDGSTLCDTAKLNYSNSWTYVWNGLSSSGDWNVTEDPVTYYSCSVSRTDNTFVVTNTTIFPPPPFSLPTPTPTTTPYTPPTYTPYTPPTATPRLPQTGVLFWPIPVAAVLGIGFILTGCRLRRRDRQ